MKLREFFDAYLSELPLPRRVDDTFADLCALASIVDEYREACAALPAARRALGAALSVKQKHELEKAYHSAVQRAANARHALLEHASQGKVA